MKKLVLIVLIMLLSITTIEAASGLSYEIIDTKTSEIFGVTHKNIQAKVQNDQSTQTSQNIHLIENKVDSGIETAV